MYKLIGEHGQIGKTSSTYYCDEYEDVETIKGAKMGDTAYVIATATVYMMNSHGEWVEQ